MRKMLNVYYILKKTIWLFVWNVILIYVKNVIEVKIHINHTNNILEILVNDEIKNILNNIKIFTKKA